MIWKLLIYFLNCRNKNYAKAIDIGNQSYIVSIEKFVPVSEEMIDWENYPGNPKARKQE